MRNLPSPDPMLETARACILVLELVPISRWAELFVDLYTLFWRRFGRGLITSTSHGLDFFHNVVGCCQGTMTWDEKGEYGDNFRKMIRERLCQAPTK